MSIGIIIADDHKIVREGLRVLLEKQRDFDVLGEAENGRTAVQLALQLRPDIVLIDIAMPDLNGIDATQRLATEVPGAKVIGLSMHFDKRYVARMLNAGASGYLRKACASEEVIRAIHTVMSGKFYISDGTSNITVRSKDQYLLTNKLVDPAVLTPKEKEILQLITEGKLTKEIAGDLNLSIKTIEKHRSSIMQKLKIRSIAELTKFAIIEGITSLEK